MIRKFRQGLAVEFGIGRRWRSSRFPGLEFEFSEPVKLIRLGDSRSVPLALLGNDMEKHRFILLFQELKGLNQQGDIMPVNGAIIAETKIFKDDARQDEMFNALFH